MKKFQATLLLIFLISFSFAQNFTMSNTTVNVDCNTGGRLYDSGGAGSDYSNNENITMTICPSDTTKGISLDWVSLGILGADEICAYDGIGVANPIIGCFNQSSSGSTSIRTTNNNTDNGCITLQFVSDASVTGNFELIISCEAPCQTVDYYIDSISPSLDTNNYSYVSLGDSFSICATGLYPNNNASYTQSDATSSFYWNLGNGVSDTGRCITYVYDEIGIYELQLIIEDINGCNNLVPEGGVKADSLGTLSNNPIKVVVLPIPEAEYTPTSIICLGTDATVSGSVLGDSLPNGLISGDTLSASGSASATGIQWASDDNVGSSSCDGIYTPMVYDLPISGYQPGATITNINQILSICTEIEHSFLGDLDIIIQCPNGQQSYLMDNDCGNSGYLGEPIDVDDSTQIGIPYQYCWSPTTTSPTMVAANLVSGTLPAGTYASQSPWSDLIGCPLNGNWQLIIGDDYGSDDGFVFSASIDLDPLLLVDADTIPIFYNPIGNWVPDSNTVSTNGNDMIVNFSTAGTYTYTYEVTDNLGNVYELTTDFIVEGFNVSATPKDSTICNGESVQLNAEVDGTTIACEPDYFQYNIPYYKETGTIIPFNFANQDNGASASIPIPFPLKYFCTNPTTFRAFTDGYIALNSNSGFSIPNNSTIPSVSAPNNILALMWDDLVDSAQVSGYFVTGTTPNRKLVIDYNLVHNGGNSTTEPVIGQIIIYETSGIIDIVCENCQQDASDPTATQGIENIFASAGVVTTGRNNSAWSATQNAIRFSPKNSLNTNYTMTWSPTTDLIGEMTQSPIASPSVSTEYVVEITNSYGCTYSDTLNINVGGDFTHNISNDTVICFGESVQLEVTGGAQTFAWTPNDGSISDTTVSNPIFTPDTTTTYTVALDSTNTCTAYETVTIEVSVLTVDSTILNNEICYGNNDGSIEIFATNSAATTNYSIDGGTTFTTTNLFSNLAPNIYNVVVQGAANCDTSYQVEIFGNPELLIDSIVTVNPSCGNTTDGSIIIYAQGGAGTLNYSIDNGLNFQTSNSFTGLLGGTYNIVIQDSLNCSKDSVFTLTQPDSIVIQIVQNDSLDCFNDSNGEIEVSASGGIGTLVFSIDNITFNNTTTFTNLDADTYTVYVRDDNMCIDSLDIEVEQPDSLFITNIQVDSTNCFGSDIGSLISFAGQGGNAPYTYAIDGITFGTNNTFNDIAVGNYQLLITDAKGCLSNQVDTSITAPTLLEFVLDSTLDATCGLNNGAIYVNGIGGTSPYSYNLNGGTSQTNGDFLNLAAGNYNVLITDANGCDTLEVVNLDGFPPAEISLTNLDSVSCFGLSDGLIEVQADNGTAPFEFSINNGTTYQTNGIFNNLTANTYSVILRDSIGCSDTLTQVVNQPTEIILSASIDSVSCFGLSDGEITLNANGGNPAYQYSVTSDIDLQNNNVYSNLAASTFTAYVVDTKNCRDSISVVVNQPDTLIITNTLATNISCFGDANGSIEINVSGGTQAYTYSLDNVSFQNSNVLSNLNGGTYTIYVVDANNCTATAIDSIIEPQELTLSVSNFTDITCNTGENGTIEVLAGGGIAPYQYSIDGISFQNSSTFNTLTANNYTITVKDNNSCIETVTQQLSEPNALSVIIDSTNLLCFGDVDGSITITSIFGETAPYSVIFDGGITQNYTPGMSFNNLAAGTYNITITDANACPLNGYSRDVTIEVPSLFEIENVLSIDPLCFGGTDGSITISTNGGGVAPYEFNLSDGTNSLSNLNGSFNNLQEGIYAIVAQDQNGCTSTSTDTLVAPDELILNIDSVLDASCFGYEDGFIQVSATGGTPFSTGNPYVFLLDNETNDINGFFTNLNESLYNILVTDANNCETTLQVQVQDPEPVIAEINPEDTIIEMGDTLILDVVLTNALGSEYIYTWTPSEGLSCTDCSNPIVQIYNDEEFALTFYDENGCFTTTSTYIEVSDTLRYFIPNAFTPGGFDLTNNLFEVYGQDIKFVDMLIFNRWGEKIYESSNALEGWDGTYQNVMQNPGVYTYFIKITFLNDDIVEKKGSVTLIR